MTSSPHTDRDTTVLIVGAGPTGLTLGCELARRGISTRIIDASPGPQSGSRGKGVQPRTLELFEDLQIADRILADGRLAMPIHLTGPDGQVTVGGGEPPELINRPDIPYTTSLITPQWRVEEALRQRLSELGTSVEFDTTLTAVERSADEVFATVSSGDTLSTTRARWIVGCDGGHSTVRAHTGIAFVGETRESVRMIVADLAVDGLNRDAWHIWRHPDGMVSLCPLPSTDLFQYQAGIAPGQDPTLTLTNMQTLLNHRGSGGDVELHHVRWSSLWRANVRLVERYRHGNAFLAGDAAHIHSPAGGQGMNTGIQDAYNLGWKLAAVAHGAPAALLGTYEAERRPIAAAVLALSDERLRHTLTTNAMPITRTADTTQLGINYRGSSLSHDDRSVPATLRAGDRAPDATGLHTADGPHRLFDLIHNGTHTLLDFAAASSWQARPDVRTWHIRRSGTGKAAGDHVVDPSGQLVSAYRATNQTLVLLRPDGYIAVISDTGDTTPINNYLAAATPPEYPRRREQPHAQPP